MLQRNLVPTSAGNFLPLSKQMTHIYTVTVVSNNPSCKQDTPLKDRFRTCVWGYDFDRENAEKAIEANTTDISECGYYQYAVLARLYPGMCSLAEELQWYEFVWDFCAEPTFVEAKKISKPRMYGHMAFGGLT